MSTSKLQRYVSSQLSIHFGKYTIRENHRPEWLNTDNGGNLELDFFIKELNLAIEVQGKQHWQFVPIFHTNREGYNSQIERDKTKKDICKRIGIKLVEVFCKDDIHSLIRDYFYTEPFVPQQKINSKARNLEQYNLPVSDCMDREDRIRKTAKKVKEENIKKLEERREKKTKKIMEAIKSRTNYKNHSNRGPFNRKLRELEKRIGRDKFIQFASDNNLDRDYLLNIFPDIEEY